MKTWTIFLVLITLLLGACVPTADESERAQQTLIEFFDRLSRGSYDEVDQFYAGDYVWMMNNNPSVNPANHGDLWENACTLNGLKCLAVRTATLIEHTGNEYVFLTEFNNPDGSRFVLGPCCGATAAEMPPISQFAYHVRKTGDGKFVVLDMPVYVP